MGTTWLKKNSKLEHRSVETFYSKMQERKTNKKLEPDIKNCATISKGLT